MTVFDSVVEKRGVQLLLLTLVAAAAMYARTAMSPLQEAMRTALALSDNQMALLQGPAPFLPMALAALPMGFLIDRCSRVRLLLVFALLGVVGSALTAFTSDFRVLFLARCVVGLAATASSLAAFSLLADLCAPAERGRATMVVVIGQYGGMSAAFALGGVLLTFFASHEDSWRWAAYGLSALLVPVVFLVLAMREPARTGLQVVKPSVRAALAEAWRYRQIVAPLMAGLTLADMVISAVMTWTAPALSRSFALPPDRVGAIMAAAVMIGGVLGPLGGGFVADLCQRTGGPRRTVSILCILAMLGLFAGLFPLAGTIEQASILLIALMTIIGAILVTGVALFIVVIPNELRGLTLAMLAGAQVIVGGALTPVVVSLLSGAIGGPAMIGKALTVVCVAASVLGAAAFAFGRRYLSSHE